MRCGPHLQYSMSLALASANVRTNEFTLRSARYGIYLHHQEPCSVIQHLATDPMPYPNQIGCDVSVVIHRGRVNGPVLLERRTTNAVLMTFGRGARYDLGYFESAERGPLVMVVSNTPSQHEDSVCHARVEVVENTTKVTMRPTWPNKITGANAGGPRQLPMRTRWAARIAQLECRRLCAS